MSARLLSLLAVVVLVGCAASDDAIDPDETGDGSGTGSSGTTGEPGSTGGGSGGSTGEPDDVEPLDLARGGIEIAGVTVNQGVQIPIADGGHWLGPDERTTRVMKGRRTLLRVFWALPTDWQPRDIEARLLLEFEDGTSRVLRETVFVEQDSNPASLHLTFNFGLEEPDMLPGVKFQVTLHEADLANESLPESPVPPISPADEPRWIGVESADMRLRVVMVPVKISVGSCTADSAEVLADPAVVQRFRDALFVQNPVQEVDLQVHPTSIDFTDYEYGDGFAPLLSAMQKMRYEDEAPANAHYYALLNRCGSGDHDGAGGYSYLGDKTPVTASQRVSAGLWCPGCGSDWSEYTFVHEVGHSQGMSHVGCGTHGHEPEPGGVAGTWGFDVLNIALKHPTTNYEYMSYCRPNWMSDWTWRFTWDSIEALTAFDMSVLAPPEGEALFGLLLPTGKQLWTRAPGSINPDTIGDSVWVEVFAGDTLIGRMPAATGTFDDGVTRYVNANLPAAADEITRLNVVGLDDGVLIVPATHIQDAAR